MTNTQIWTSQDNVTFTLAATVAGPATQGNVTPATTPNILFAKVRYCNSSGVCGAFSPVLRCPGAVADWWTRILANGGNGTTPGNATLSAVDTFYLSLFDNSLVAQMISMCLFVPDGLISAITPLIKTAGNDPWTNFNNAFVVGDLTVNGLAGNATTKALDTGLILGNIWQNTGGSVNASTSGGISIYNSTLGATANVDSGIREDQPSNCFGLFIVNSPGVSNLLLADFSNQTVGNGRISVTNTGWTGFTSFNNTSPTARAVYVANSVTPFATLGTAAGTINGNAFPGAAQGSLVVFGNRNSAGTIVPNVDRRYSFAAIHLGLSSAQAQNLFNAVQALRVALGGGFI